MLSYLMLIVLLSTTVATAQVSADGIVTDVRGDRVALSLGVADGIAAGQKCVIYRRESFSHPVTGEEIEIPRLLVADAEVMEAGAVFSTAIVTWSEMAVRRGDFVRVGDRDALAVEDRPVASVAGSAAAASLQPTTAPAVGASARPDSLGTAARSLNAPAAPPAAVVSAGQARRQRAAPPAKPAKRRPVAPERGRRADTAADSLAAGPTGAPSGRKSEDIMSAAESELENRYEEAVSALKASGKKGGGAVDAHFWVGMKHYGKRDFATAAGHFRKVIDGRSEPSIRQKALFQLAMCYYQMNKNDPARLDEAKAVFRQIVQEYPNRAIDASQWIETIEWLQRAGSKRQQQKTSPSTEQRESTNELARNNR